MYTALYFSLFPFDKQDLFTTLNLQFSLILYKMRKLCVKASAIYDHLHNPFHCSYNKHKKSFKKYDKIAYNISIAQSLPEV